IEAPYPVYETELTSLNRLKLVRRFDVELDSPAKPTQAPARPAAKPQPGRGLTRPIFSEHGASSASISAANRPLRAGIKTTTTQPELSKPDTSSATTDN